MEFIISANTDVGIAKQTNQDSLTVKLLDTSQGKMVFGVLCDGMGGMDKGEVASASVIRAFEKWAFDSLPLLCSENEEISENIIEAHWNGIVSRQNEVLKAYGARQGIQLGTTVVAMLLTQRRYYILNVGDSRAYELTDALRQITADQTFVAREIAMGNMTEEQARMDSRRNVLLQCVGVSDGVFPEMFFGEVKSGAVYMLCSDGFRHEITPKEIYEKFAPHRLADEETMNRNTVSLIELNKSRMERDNISVILVKAF